MRGMPMGDEDMELDELAQLKGLAKEGMAKEFKHDMGGFESVQPVPGAEGEEPDGAEEACEACGGEGCEACSGGESSGLSPELLAQVLASLK